MKTKRKKSRIKFRRNTKKSGGNKQQQQQQDILIINDNDDLKNKVKEYFETPDKLPPIGKWNVEKVTNMSYLFYNATSFNEDISEWNVGNVTDMASMFFNATSFNKDISKWNVGNVTNMYAMFYNATSFNQDISKWNVGKVTNMGFMFSNATSFDQDISNWDVSNVNDMSRMFYRATAFNQDLNKWDVKKVTDVSHIFEGATNLKCDIRWDFNKVNLDLTIHFILHSNCNVYDVGKPSLFEEEFDKTKYKIDLAYNAYMPGTLSFIRGTFPFKTTKRTELRKYADAYYSTLKKCKDYLEEITKSYFINAGEIKNLTDITNINTNNIKIQKGIEEKKLIEIIENLEQNERKISSFIDMKKHVRLYIQIRDKIVAVNNDLEKNNQLEGSEIKLAALIILGWLSLHGLEPDKYQTKYYTQPKFKLVKRLYKQTYTGTNDTDNDIGGLYINFKESQKLLETISKFLLANNIQDSPEGFFEENLNSKLLSNEHTASFLRYILVSKGIPEWYFNNIMQPVMQNFHNTNNILTSEQLKEFIELMANNVGNCKIYHMSCLGFKKREELDEEREGILTKQVESNIIASPASSGS